VLLALVTLAASLILQETAQPLAGCHSVPDLLGRVRVVKAADWNRWSRADLGRAWPDHLEFMQRDFATNEVIWFRRTGRLIDGRLECGETYRFFPPVAGSGDTLREFWLSHAEPRREDALSVAHQIERLIGPPPDAGRAQRICVDCGDPGDEVVSRQWLLRRELRIESNMLQIYVRQGARTHVLDLTWVRSRE
jgi:hypothetical protein